MIKNCKEKINLTSSQYEAIKTINRPVLVVAVAGSGKTRVITEKIKFLIENNYSPDSIVAITFTNKAANEMKKRVESFFPYSLPYVTTIHSFCLKLLKQYNELFNVKKDFLVADEETQLDIIKILLKEQSNEAVNYLAKNIRHEISILKINLEQNFDKLVKIFNNKNKALEFYKSYKKYLLQNNLLDFGDLILKVVDTLKNNEEIKLYFQDKFSYFLVDEYQDTNQIQRLLLKLLVNDNNITAVGDEDQSIYSFRGSDVTNIMNFEHDFKNAKIIFMETNFRSNINILKIANEVIKKNKLRRKKKLIPFKGSSGEVCFYREYNEKAEAKRLINIIKNNIKNGYNYNDIAILYRANWQSAYIEQQLFKNNIPYKIYNGMSFYKRKEIKIIFHYIGYILNSNSLILLKNIINVPKRGVGEKTFNDICDKFQSFKNGSLLDFLKSYKNKKIKEFAEKIVKLEKVKSPLILINSIIKEFKLLEYFEKYDSERFEERKENINQLYKIAKEYENDRNENEFSNTNLNPILEFYNQFMLYTNENPLNIKGVNLLTLHSAKGLEFKIVIIIGVVNGIIPMIKKEELFESISDFEVNEIKNKRIEEERRLFYVGITRAMEKLYFTSYYYTSNYISSYYKNNNEIKNVSCFLAKLPKKYFNTIYNSYSNQKNYLENKDELFSNYQKNTNNNGLNKNRNNSINRILNNDNNNAGKIFKTGDNVLIRNYGKGFINKIEKFNNLTKLYIKMEDGNDMIFIKEFAKIEKI